MIVVKCGPETKPVKTFELQLKDSSSHAGVSPGVVVLNCRVNGVDNWLLSIREKDGKLYFDRYAGTQSEHYDQESGYGGQIKVT